MTSIGEPFPRILVVTSNNFNSVNGGGITLTNLFRGWPKDCIANLHEDPTAEDRSVCDNFYRLTTREIIWSWPFSIAQPHSEDTGALGGAPAKGARATAMKATALVFGDGIPRSVRVTAKLKGWLDAFRPQLVYSFLGSMAQIRVTSVIAQQRKTPVAIHVMDDWPTVVYQHGLLAPFLRRRMMREFETLLRQAPLRMGICEDMCADYQVRYGCSFEPFHNALDMDEWLSCAKTNWQGGTPFVVRYVGSVLAEGQRDSLQSVCEVIAQMRRSGIGITMSIHSPLGQVQFLKDKNFEGVSLFAPPAKEEIHSIFKSADLLVLPFNFDEKSRQYLRLSMPTKIPAYMVSGTPVFVLGPPDIAPVRYAVQGGWAHVLSSRTAGDIQKALKDLMSNVVLRERLAKTAMNLARTNHDAANVRVAFQNSLIRAAGSYA